MHSRLWAHSPLSLSHTLNSVCAADRARAICDLEIPALVCWLPWGSRVVTCERWPGASECVSTPTRGYAYVRPTVLRVRTSRVQCVRVGPSRAGSGESASEADCARATANAATAAPPGAAGRSFSHMVTSWPRTVLALDPVALSYVLERRVNEAARASRLSRALLSESLSLSLSRSLVPLAPAPIRASLLPSTSAGPACRPKLSYPRQPPGTWLTTTLAATNTPPFIMWSR